MRNLARSLLIALLAFGAPAAGAQELAPNERILIEYVEPHHPLYSSFLDPDDPQQAAEYQTNVKNFERYGTIMQRLKARRLLEEFSVFLRPLKLPIMLRLRTQECGEANAFYDPVDSSLNLCYEFVAEVEDRAPRTATPEGFTRNEVIVGQIVATLLHEGGHAISNLLRLPVLGREEDTADQIAAFIMLQFGRDVARTLIKGETYGWNQRQRAPSRFWGPHSTALQRQHTFLCLAYGSDPEGFADFVTRFRWLPPQRAGGCAAEYAQVQHAFRTTVLPHVDAAEMDKVRKRRWLMPDDGK